MAGAIGVLPPSSRLRRRAVDRIVRGAYASVERRDLDSLLVRYSPDVRYHAAPQHVAMGGFDAIYRGHSGVRRYLGSWMDTWEAMRFELHEISDRGDIVMVLEDFYGRPHGTSAELKERQGRVVRLQRGLVVEEHWLMSWEETRRLAAQFEG